MSVEQEAMRSQIETTTIPNTPSNRAKRDALWLLLKEHLGLKSGVTNLKIELGVKRPTVIEVSYWHYDDPSDKTTGIPPLNQQ